MSLNRDEALNNRDEWYCISVLAASFYSYIGITTEKIQSLHYICFILRERVKQQDYLVYIDMIILYAI